MLTALILVKLILEIALMAIFGRWVLGLLAGARKEQNLFWQVLDIMCRPFIVVARFVAPRQVIDRDRLLDIVQGRVGWRGRHAVALRCPGAEVDLTATRRAERPPGAFRLPRHRFAAARAVHDTYLFAHACLTDCRT